MGLGNASGFEFRCASLAGAPPTDLAAVARGLMIAAKQDPELSGVLHDLRRGHAADQPQARPRAAQTLGVIDQRHLRGPADDAGRHLRQRLQPVRPHLAGEGAGRGARPQEASTTSSACACARQRRPGAAAGRGAEHRADHRALLDHPLQQPAFGDDERAPRRRATRRARRSPPWRRSPTTLPAGYGYEWTGTALQEKAAAGQTGFILALAVVFAYLFLVGALRELDDPGRRAAVGRRSACSAPCGALLSRPRQQHLCPDRHRRADRARRQERHPDHRVRDGRARARARTS